MALLAAGLSAATAHADCPPPAPGENEFRRGQVMVRVAANDTVENVLGLINQPYPGTTVIRSLESRSIYVLQIPPGEIDCDVVTALLATLVNPDPNTPDPNRPLNWAELNYETEAAEGATGTIYISMAQPDAQPLYANQYVTTVLTLPAAHVAATGRGTAVAVLDTGIDASHPELQGLVLPGFNFLTMTTDTADVGDGLDTDGDLAVDEMVGHGTYVSGLVHLVAPEAKILPIVVLNGDGFGEAFDIALGIFYAIDHGVEVINMSFGSSAESRALHDAIGEARSTGIVVVSAAGNDNRVEPPRFPAFSGDNIAVAATDDDDIRAPFSNHNNNLFISAPGTSAAIGVDLYDQNRSIFSTIPGGDFAVWEGTSMSAALVSGAAALIRAQHPEWALSADTVQNVELLLAGTAIDIDPLNPGFEGELGAGRLDVAAAVAQGPPQPGIGDIDGNGIVDLTDLAVLLVDFGKVHSSADINADGIVDLTDLGLLLINFGT